jgi:hypothetical protein
MVLMLCCKKLNQRCIPIPDNTKAAFGWNYNLDTPYFSATSFNPLNSNEFCYIKGVGSVVSLLTFNMQSKISTPVYTGNVFYEPQWGSNNWILFDANNIVYKVKTNGDSLTQLTYNASFTYPKWSADASELIAAYFIAQSYGAYIYSATGVLVDSLSVVLGAPYAWRDSLIIGCRIMNPTSNFGIYNFNTKNLTWIGNPDFEGYSGACFITPKQFIWANQSGIYITDWQMGSTITIKSLCNSESYMWPSYNFQSNKVLWNKGVENQVNSTTLGVHSSIVMMNPDGSDEQEINIP